MEEAFRNEQGKVKDILLKYIELKKKYEVVEKKLKKANEKIVELLQTKIMLSPKASQAKKIEFPTEDRTNHHSREKNMQFNPKGLQYSQTKPQEQYQHH